MTRSKHIVVIGASAGGIEALRALVAALDEEFPAPICVVLHSAPEAPGVLDAILTRAGRLPATNAANGERLQPGHIYVAPPDFHLVVEPGLVRVTKGPRENRFRPAIDPLFRSAAQVYGPGAIGVILTGSLDDGTDGLWAIKQLGGCAIVQDPLEALFPSMPQNAIDHVNVDYILPLAEIAPMLARLTSVPVEPVAAARVTDVLRVEVKIAMEENPIDAGLERIGTPSNFSCPECHGVLLELKEGTRTKFRCHTGHAYSIASLLAAVGEGIEDSMWTAVRALEEGHLLMTRMAEHFKVSHDSAYAEQLFDRANEARQQSDVIRQLVMQREPLSESNKSQA
ncbi:MAG TPA: chemotaxis protein CheB [Vicinamibacterales bacterium]|nr:chemotaxis protein CheB [Vicinamibacterales bacterium]